VTVTSQDPPRAAPGAWRRVLADVIRFDPRGIRVGGGLRVAVGASIALAIGYANGSWAAGAAAAGGALSVGVTSVVPSPRPRIALLTSTAAAMALGTFIGSSTSAYAGLHVVAVALFSFAGGLLVAVQPAAASVGLNAIVGLVVYGRFPASPERALETAGLVAAGGLFQVLVTVVARGRSHVDRALAGLSRAYTELASYAADLDIARSGLPIAAAVDSAVVDREFSFGVGVTGTAAQACTSLADEARRMRLELLSLASARDAARNSDHPDAALLATFERLASSVHGFLADVADGLAHADVPADLDDALASAGNVIDELRRVAAAAPDSTLIAARATTAGAALAGQLRAVAALLPDAVDLMRPAPLSALRSARRVSRRGARGAEAIAERMWANLTWRSDGFQHAVRVTLVVSAAAVIAHAVGIGRGYWLALTAVLVLRPEFSQTFTRGIGRALGTLIGVGIATTIALTTHPHGWALVAMVGVFVWVTCALFNASYAVFSVAVTGAVVFLLVGIDTDPVTAARDRLIATVLGSALALVAYVLWPSWGRRPVADAIADLADATRRYSYLALRGVMEPDTDGSAAAATAAAGRQVRLARTNAEAAISRSLGDPASRRIDHTLTVDVLATFRRLAIATHTLRLSPTPTLDTGAGVPPALRELAAALDTELGSIAARLRFGRVTVVRAPLRAQHREVADALSGGGPLATLVIAETDEMVDATNSLAEILDRAPAALTT
jgi:uncharacterized membrane protein YccC